MANTLLNATRLAGTLILVSTAAHAQAPFHLQEATIDQIRDELTAGRVSCRELIGHYLKRIDAYDHAGPMLNALQTVNRRALEEADRLDAAYRASGPVGPLHCIPVLVKDQVETSDLPTTYGSILFKGFTPRRDATVVRKLKAAGAIVIGKTNMGEFAAGYLGSAFGIVRNAYDPARSPAGSSSGSGVGVAANFAVLAVAEDTGGSVRGPAAHGNAVGLRPTVPLVSRFGMMPATPTQDTLGPIARTVRDAALMLDVIAGYDPNDPVTAYADGHIPATYTEFLKRDGLKGARLGVLRLPLDPKADPQSSDYNKVRALIDRAVTDMRTQGAEIVDPLPPPEMLKQVDKLFTDNVYETEQAIDTYLAGHPGAPVKTLRDILLTGKVVPSRSNRLITNIGRTINDPGNLSVIQRREQLRQAVLNVMADLRLDAIVHATFDYPPGRIPLDPLTIADPAGVGDLGNNRRLAPLLAFPALSVPAGFTPDGLPVGIEFLGRQFSEGRLLTLGYAFEQATHHRRPPKSTPSLPGEP
ncbi:MAG TPA: amidase family protein [Vicinamibacterales bacterium]|nr:amidase family protein [Vicinamibacterales bacterium]